MFRRIAVLASATAGVVAVGCRPPLVAFNIDLSTPDVAVASAIARTIRASSGGLPCVKALGVMLEPRHLGGQAFVEKACALVLRRNDRCAGPVDVAAQLPGAHRKEDAFFPSG